MRLSRTGVVFMALSLTVGAHGARAQGGRPGERGIYPEVTIPNTEVRRMHSRATGNDYDLYIYLPRPESRGADKKYPVLYLLDGQWDFKLLTSIQGGLVYDKWTPDVIIVGITYTGAHANYDSLRAVDYTPVADPSTPWSGGGAKFLSFLKTELIPFMETNYQGDPAHRLLMGSSLGGLFTLYAMFSEPTLFSGYAACSPAVTYANRGAFAQEAAFSGSHSDLATKLFVSVGDKEELFDPVTEYLEELRGRHYKSLVLESRLIEGERHSGNKPEAYNRALRYLFQH
jgi:predicted alpha/beta superfamily hydrolase